MDTKSRITENMNFIDVVSTMSEGNPGCMSFLTKYLNDSHLNYLRILKFDSMGIYGSKLYMLWNDCCDRNLETVNEVIDAYAKGKLTLAEIHENLNQTRAQPFDLN